MTGGDEQIMSNDNDIRNYTPRKCRNYDDYLNECRIIGERWDVLLAENPQLEDRRRETMKALYDFNGGICKMHYTE